jgi:Fe-S oxidoreductase
MASIAIQKPVIDTTEGCRYCLMCRHVCPVTRVTFNEATSPHGWALEIASVQRGLLQWNAETVDLLYQCADCGLCNAFCVTDQPLPEAIVAARAAVVAGGHAPARVPEIEATLRRGLHAEGLAAAEVAEAALFAGMAAIEQRAALDAARVLLGHVDLAHGVIGAGRDSGYLAYTLGLHDTARELARATAEEIRRAGVQTLIALAPEDAYTFTRIYPLLGEPLPDTVWVADLTELLARALDEGRLRLRTAPIELAYHDPCHAPRARDSWDAPRRLLAAATEHSPREGFWRERRAAPCGASGGLALTQPRLADQLARSALADATASGVRVVVTEAPGCLMQLRRAAPPDVQVRGLYELLAERIEN